MDSITQAVIVAVREVNTLRRNIESRMSHNKSDQEEINNRIDLLRLLYPRANKSDIAAAGLNYELTLCKLHNDISD